MSRPEPARDRADTSAESGAGGTTGAGGGTPSAVDVSSRGRTSRALGVFLAGPVISMTHFMLVYLVVEAGCTGDGPGLNVFDPPVPTVVTLAATAVAAVGCLLAAGVGYRRWRAGQDGGASGTAPAGGPALPFAGFLLSLLSFVLVLFVGLPAVVLPACAP